MNFFFLPPVQRVCKSRQPFDRSWYKKKKKEKSWRVANPDTISPFPFDVAPLYTRRIKIEIDRCDRRCLNSLKKIRVARRGNWKSQFVRFRGGEGKRRERVRNPGSQLVIIVWKCRIKAVVVAYLKRINCHSPLSTDFDSVYFY